MPACATTSAIGDLVLATGYVRDDRVLDDMLPVSVPVISNHTLNTLLLGELTARRLRSRMGIVYTTANRNWELHLALVADRLRQSRALAVDMESATVAANGFRYRIPTAAELDCPEPLDGQAGAVSDSWARRCPAIPPGAGNWGRPGSGDRDPSVPGGLVVQKRAG